MLIGETHICSYKYEGTAGGMKTEGAKRVFERSVEKHNLRYVKFLGDGDSKSYQTVKNTYPGIDVGKLECVGHYQKRIGNRLRKLKKREKVLVDMENLLTLLLTAYKTFTDWPFDRILEI